jgi:hypothetical protein
MKQSYYKLSSFKYVYNNYTVVPINRNIILCLTDAYLLDMQEHADRAQFDFTPIPNGLVGVLLKLEHVFKC